VADAQHGHNNHRFWKRVSGILAIIVVAEGGLLIRNDRQIALLETKQAAMGETVDTHDHRQIATLETKQVAMGKTVDAHEQWIDDWYNKLQVPERDQRQDSNIEELQRRLFVLEKHYIEMMEKVGQ